MLTTHEIEDILDRVRAWLRETDEELDYPSTVALAEQLAGDSAVGGPRGPSAESVGLLQVANSFTALRHEIKLQTKALRGLQEHVRDNDQSLKGAISELESTRRDVLKSAEESTNAAIRQLIMGLLDVEDALRQAVRTAKQTLPSPHDDPLTEPSLLNELTREFHRLPAWKRLWLQGFWTTVQQRLQEARTPRPPTAVPTETLRGLQLLQSRVRRVLSEAEVEPTQCVGHRVEPRTMRVVEVVDDPSQPPETVVSEVRAGYQWRGVTLRAAEVCATRSSAPQERGEA